MDDMTELPERVAGALRGLSADAERAAARVDPARTAERVLERLRTETPDAATPRWHWSARGLRIAAALVVLAAAGTWAGVRAFGPHGTGTAVAAGPLPIVSPTDSLNAELAAAVLETMDSSGIGVGSVNDPVAVRAVSVDDLNEAELQALLELKSLGIVEPSGGAI